MADTEIKIEVIARSDDAIRVYNGKVKAWVPKSQISDYTSDGDVDTATTIFIPRWIAEDKGLI